MKNTEIMAAMSAAALLRTSAENVQDVLDAISTLAAPTVQAPVQTAGEWVSVDERLPTKYCLAVYVTPRGRQHIIRAMHVKQFQIEANGDECDSESNDADDLEYIKAGWYECIDNWGEYSSVAVCEGDVTHWMALPPVPGQQVAQGEKGGELKAVTAFLMGEAELEGVVFGDRHPTKAGAFWWRHNLRAALHAAGLRPERKDQG